MKFSILIANYNNGKFFKNCFDSIVSQTYQNWEAVILDDASTDNSVDVIREIIKDDSRFRLHFNTENSGVGVTKSKLIDLSKGEICGFADPDDAIAPNALKSAADIYLKEKNTVLTYSKFAKCDENMKVLSVPKLAMQVPNGDDYFFNCPVHIVHFVTFKKEIYKKTSKINTSLKIAEDQDLYLKMYEKGDVRFIDEVLYFYRTHSGGISQNSNLPKSRAYFAEVILAAMKRRNLTHINGKKIPAETSSPQEIFDLLNYQTEIPFRLKKKLKVLSQKLLRK
ncbi:glycosyl transferase family 2 [Chryseobacterium sp. Leaf180]|uniref:glycosyltransferase n=1 Tax=Chryseobacterium sp. Leaf180 TaxID=1736289 RepID=UPI0006FAA45A|nr:glycosyltransferase [Chryseobacterium sp. Leaf180]KQR95471.1 glycosyl transferase family 2 [Chryseobacterium sp. Leaf180]